MSLLEDVEAAGGLAVFGAGSVPGARDIRDALVEVVREGETLTRDLGGTAGTQEFADAIIAKLE